MRWRKAPRDVSRHTMSGSLLLPHRMLRRNPAQRLGHGGAHGTGTRMVRWRMRTACWTDREARSLLNCITDVRTSARVATSTVKKSVAFKTSQCSLKNCAQLMPALRR